MLVNTDIVRFYNSIYTHSVPWVLHGKTISKKNQSSTLIGNRIDRALRNCRDRQTIGVPIGPDTSLIIAELILSEIDVILSARMPSLRALRYVDDYELVLDSYDQAEDAVGILQEMLLDYEFELNPAKTEVHTLPVPHEYRWVSEIRSLPLRSGSRTQSNDLVRLFDRAFDFAKDSPGEPVLRYLMGRLKGFISQPDSLHLYQHLLLQCITVEPGTIPTAIGHIIDQARAGGNIDTHSIEETLNHFIEFHAPLGHHNEVSWAVWGVMVLRLTIHDKARVALERMNDSVAVLSALHAEDEGRFSSMVDKSGWQKLMNAGSLYGEHWLLSYEALVRGWLPSADGRDYVSADPYFRFISTLGIKFYKERAVVGVQPTGVPPSVGIAPVFYA